MFNWIRKKLSFKKKEVDPIIKERLKRIAAKDKSKHIVEDDGIEEHIPTNEEVNNSCHTIFKSHPIIKRHIT